MLEDDVEKVVKHILSQSQFNYHNVYKKLL
jgi:hypothetical protein